MAKVHGLFLILLVLSGYCVFADTDIQVLGAESCATSGCHGGAGPNRGAYTLWQKEDPHASAAATLVTARSQRMAEGMGFDDATTAESCTACHAPMRQVNPGRLARLDIRNESVSCANCHGPAEKWILSHTREDYSLEALQQLGMRRLDSAYHRANNCVSCHQNISDALIDAGHPRLVFELDGLLVAEPRHWREDEGFSHARTWLVGQAAALREAVAYASIEPGERRAAEIEALQLILKNIDAGWGDGSGDAVRDADSFARKVSHINAFTDAQVMGLLKGLVGDRSVFDGNEANSLTQGYYAERLTLAIDRLHEALVVAGNTDSSTDLLVNELFEKSGPPESFNRSNYLETLDKLNEVLSE